MPSWTLSVPSLRGLMLVPSEGHCSSPDGQHLWTYTYTLSPFDSLSPCTETDKHFYKMCIVAYIFKYILAFPGILHHSCFWTMNTWTGWPCDLQTLAIKSQIVTGSSWWVLQSPCDFAEVDAFLLRCLQVGLCVGARLCVFPAPWCLSCTSANGSTGQVGFRHWVHPGSGQINVRRGCVKVLKSFYKNALPLSLLYKYTNG